MSSANALVPGALALMGVLLGWKCKLPESGTFIFFILTQNWNEGNRGINEGKFLFKWPILSKKQVENAKKKKKTNAFSPLVLCTGGKLQYMNSDVFASSVSLVSQY